MSVCNGDCTQCLIKRNEIIDEINAKLRFYAKTAEIAEKAIEEGLKMRLALDYGIFPENAHIALRRRQRTKQQPSAKEIFKTRSTLPKEEELKQMLEE